MVSVGARASLLRKHSNSCSFDFTKEEYTVCNRMGKERKMGRKDMKKSRTGHEGNFSNEKFGHKPAFKQENAQTSLIRKQIDPDTASYYAQIARVVDGGEIEFEERANVCGNALDEARGKEMELATDYIISHTMQALLEGCSVEHLCGFLKNCSKSFVHIAMDRSGSHVAETALKALASHLQDSENDILIEETVNVICKTTVVNAVDILCNCHGSHVLRSLLCLCRGVPLDSSEFHSTKSTAVLAERLSTRDSYQNNNDLRNIQPRFPELYHFLVSEMLNSAKKNIAMLRCNQFSSLVFQTALKLSAGEEQFLLHVIPLILGCSSGDAIEGNIISVKAVQNLLSLLGETAFSHLMEVVLEVSPDTLYEELFQKVFRNSLFSLSSDQCGNFVVQALISHVRTQHQMELIWEDLGSKFKDLLEYGRSGVVASLFAACQKLQSHGNECSQALAAAVCPKDESPRCIVPRILFLDNYFYSGDKPNWSWPHGFKMHLLGSLMLQSIFRLPTDAIGSYISSITSLDSSEALQASKDPSGSRVIEAFLSSNASSKQKQKLMAKLRGHFGELAVHPSGSFSVDKCYSAANLSMRETIVSELLPVQKDLTNTKQGPYILKKFDVEGYAKHPDQWKSRQNSKQSAYREFVDFFAPPSGTEASRKKSFLADTKAKSQPEKMKDIRKEIDSRLANIAPKLNQPFLAHQGSKSNPRKSGSKRSQEGANITKVAGDDNDSRSKKKRKF